jgi:subtilisin family serine protease
LLLLWFVALIALAVEITSPAYAQDSASARTIVVFKPGFADVPRQAGLLRAHGAEPLQALEIVNAMSALLPPGAAVALAHRAEVLRVEPDREVCALGAPQARGPKPPPPPPPQSLPWGVDRIDAEWAWSVTGGAGIKVAVIDTGIDADHPDLAANVKGGVNFVRARGYVDPGRWDDDNGHGSHVAGIIGARDNAVGAIGVAPECSLYALKVLNKNGMGYTSDVIAAIQWAVNNGMDIANLSLGSNSPSVAEQLACDTAAAAGLLIVAAAGNDGGAVDYPGAYSSVIAVAATNSADAVASWSSNGPEVDIAAPGVSVFSCYKNGGYATMNGTSMATPHVTGALALTLAAGRSTNLCLSADDLPPAGLDNYSGCGLVDAGEAATGTLNYGDN